MAGSLTCANMYMYYRRTIGSSAEDFSTAGQMKNPDRYENYLQTCKSKKPPTE
eukprot:CAMPEP_0170629666 /NCGR_PEP_ID=MMETSP0224-20130122/33490_1 /TAXON_ID=285029 /ORGANISM="Togula jolla, Strain CCCM 725" /LENGTH=52 /DNA_ID=CAMNT_0010957475 /DNA_START=168 /DNA_END=324 /DNA_ORIENTATION=-